MFAGCGTRTTDQGYAANTQADGHREQFTGYERDSETELDFAQARYFASAQGRFTSVDPLLASGRPINPQSWNRYSYALNRPLSFIDPSGMFPDLASLGELFQTKQKEGEKPAAQPQLPDPPKEQTEASVNKIPYNDGTGSGVLKPNKDMRDLLSLIYNTQYQNQLLNRIEDDVADSYGSTVPQSITTEASSTETNGGKVGGQVGAEIGASPKASVSINGEATTSNATTTGAKVTGIFRPEAKAERDVNYNILRLQFGSQFNGKSILFSNGDTGETYSVTIDLGLAHTILDRVSSRAEANANMLYDRIEEFGRGLRRAYEGPKK